MSILFEAESEETVGQVQICYPFATLDATVLPVGTPLTVALDGQELELPIGAATGFHYERNSAGQWRSRPAPDPWEKNPDRAGPFKDAFRHRMVLVHGTRGSAAETAWASAKARFDAETFWYRGNGSVDVVNHTRRKERVFLARGLIVRQFALGFERSRGMVRSSTSGFTSTASRLPR